MLSSAKKLMAYAFCPLDAADDDDNNGLLEIWFV